MFARVQEDLDIILNALQDNMAFTLGVIAIMFVVHFINVSVKMRLNVLGIYPRNPFGLIGIPCSPFLHGDFNHVFFNSIPLFALMNMVLIYGMNTFIYATLTIMLVGGGAVWLFGRKALHVGASTVIMGYFGFILVQSYLAPSLISILALIICLFYFGGLVASLLPSKGTSWEGHIFGFFSGMLAYQVCLRLQ